MVHVYRAIFGTMLTEIHAHVCINNAIGNNFCCISEEMNMQ